MLKEFKEFISRGNVIDLAVGLIMATYFGAIVKSLVDDLLMPVIGKLIGGIDFKNMEHVLSKAVQNADGTETAAVSIRYGVFINNIITFIIVAFAVFMVVKGYNRLKKKKEEGVPQEAAAAQ